MFNIKFHSFFFCAFIISTIFLVSAPGEVTAGKKPSPKTCEEMGLLDVTCFECATGKKIGMISVLAEYDTEYGDCARRYREARRKCASTYGRKKSEVACKWSHSMGGTTYSGSYPASCKK